jgi:hypothetical protein
VSSFTASQSSANEALDPTVLVDTEAVSSAVVAAELRRDRLQAALPRLQQRFVKLEAAERYARWMVDYEDIRARRDTLAAELRALYPPLVVKLADLMDRIEAIDSEVKRINATKPIDADAANGDGRGLDLVETVARGGARLNETVIVRDLKLPHWNPGDGFAWPPFRLALPFQLSELEENQIRQQRDGVRQRARDVATEVGRHLAAE